MEKLYAAVSWYRVFVFAALVGLLGPNLPARAATEVPRPEPGAIHGLIVLDGCTAAEVRIDLEAVPAVPMSGSTRAGDDLGPAELRRKSIVRAVPVGGQLMTFGFTGLADGAAYRIGFRTTPPDRGNAYPPNPCARLIWAGLPGSIAIAGGPVLSLTATRIDGSLTTRVRTSARGAPSWQRAGVFDLADADLGTPTLRWLPGAGVTGGMLQVALDPFGRTQETSPCVTPRRLLFERLVTTDDLLRRDDGSFELEGPDFGAVLAPSRIAGSTGRDADADRPLHALTQNEVDMLRIGHPVYVRIVPVDAAGPRCDVARHGLPAWLVFVIASSAEGPADPPPVADALQVVPPVALYRGPVVYTYPDGKRMCMRSTKPHALQASGAFDLLASSWTGYKIGQVLPADRRFCWGVGSGGGGFDPIDTVGEIVGGVLTPFEWLVNGVSGMWEDIKLYAVKVVASGITELKIVDCSAACQAVLRGGLEIGLAAIGLPPSIPNFDQLKQQGLDYVAAQIASQTGLPTAVTEWAVNRSYQEMATTFADHMSKARTSGLPNLDWAVWDGGIEPATLAMTIERSAQGGLPTALRFPGNAIFAQQTVPVPRVFLDANGKPGGSSVNSRSRCIRTTWRLPTRRRAGGASASCRRHACR